MSFLISGLTGFVVLTALLSYVFGGCVFWAWTYNEAIWRRCLMAVLWPWCAPALVFAEWWRHD